MKSPRQTLQKKETGLLKAVPTIHDYFWMFDSLRNPEQTNLPSIPISRSFLFSVLVFVYFDRLHPFQLLPQCLYLHDLALFHLTAMCHVRINGEFAVHPVFHAQAMLER